MNLEQARNIDQQCIVGTYPRSQVLFTGGQGATLFDQAGKRYLDMTAGIAVTALGHGNPALVKAIQGQVEQLIHVSNLYYTEPQMALAKSLVEASFADKVFFTNSGSEANETAFKFARKWAKETRGDRKDQVLAFTGSFHGRSMGALSLTYKSAYRDPFEPLIQGVSFAPFNDVAALEESISDRTYAVFVEPVQGEGGVRPASKTFMQRLRELCDQHEALLIFDEVQCGLGRTGQLWAHQWYGIEPDVMTLAKPLAGGLPIGVTLVRDRVSSAIDIGDHGSTFGGGPVVCRAGLVSLEEISRKNFLDQVKQRGAELKSALSELPSSAVREVRGHGLLVGLELDRPVRPILEKALAQGLLIINAGENVIRLCPPLTITSAQINQAVETIADCLGNLDG